MEIKEASKSFLKVFFILLGIFLSLFSLAGLVGNLSSMDTLFHLGSVGIVTEAANDSTFVVTSVEPDGAAEEVGVIVGDSIIRINNLPIKKGLSYSDYWGEPKTGVKLDISIKKDNKVKQVTIVKKNAGFKGKILAISMLITLPLLMLIYSLVGLWILFKNRVSLEVITIVVVCYSIGALMYTIIQTGVADSDFLKTINYTAIKNEISNIVLFVPAFWILLFSIFPEKTKFYKNHKILLILLIFFMPVLAILADYIPSLFEQARIIKKIIIIWSLLYILVGLVIGIIILKVNAKRFIDALRVRQFKLIFFGIKYGGISLVTGWVILLLFEFVKAWRFNLELVVLSLFLLGSIGGLLIPFTFLNTLQKKKLLETEWLLRKKIRDVLITAGLFIIYIFIIFHLSDIMVSKFNLSDQSFIILITIFISFTFFPINQILHNKLEKKLHPERFLYQKKIKEFMRRLQTIAELKSLLNEFSEWIESNMKVKSAITYSLSGVVNRDLPFIPKEESSIINKINQGAPFFWDELPEEQKDRMIEQEQKWAQENNISISFPMISHGELVGVLNIGKKTNNEDYSGEDIEIFKEYASQTALSMQNLKLQLEYIEKKRLDKELNLARSIQAQLVPRSIPKVKGLDVFGKMRACFEVAGDYFDIIPIDDNKTLLTVADVSGKGAGAAMLMSNLQAALHSSLKFSSDMKAIVYEINNLINENTSPGQFITFFTGMWDSSSGKFDYINAGHNPPIVIKSDNKIIQLKSTGFFLGPLPKTEYRIDSITLSKGDLLALYTDGIDETFNPEYEQFGLDRIIDALMKNKQKSAEEMCNLLYEETGEFAAGLPYADDATVIIAKVI